MLVLVIFIQCETTTKTQVQLLVQILSLQLYYCSSFLLHFLLALIKSICKQPSNLEKLVFQALGVPVHRLVQAADSVSV